MNDRNNPDLPDAPAEAETPLCLGCLTPNLPEAHFCAKCGAPLTSYAATGPLERQFAMGHAYRQAAEHPRRFVVVAFIWLIFGLNGLASLFLISMGSRENLLPLIVGGFMAAISVAMLWRTTRAYLTRPRPTPADDE